MFATIATAKENDYNSLLTIQIIRMELKNFQTYLVAYKACCFMVKD